MDEVPYGYCHCGCGQKTKIARQTDRKWGIVAGEPMRFINGHSNRSRDALPNPNPSGLCLCGCGQPTSIATITRNKWGHVKGFPTPFVRGHSTRMLPTIEERFWKYVDKRGPDECWEWQGARTEGYGTFAPLMHFNVPAHRYSYELHRGPILNDLFVCHHCDNRPCVNPEHLFLGTQKDNMQDMVSKDRHKHKLNAEQVIEIRRLSTLGMSQAEIGKQFGVHQSQISSIVLRKTHKHVE